MRRNRFREYLTQSLMGFGSLALAILFFFALYKAGTIIALFNKLVGILMPMIYGAVIAFLLSPPCNRIQDVLEERIPQTARLRGHRRHSLIKCVSVGGTVLAAVVVVYLLLMLLVPQLFTSILNLINSIPTLSANLTNWISQTLEARPELQSQVMGAYDQIGENVLNWIQNTFLPQFQSLMSEFSVGVLGLFSTLWNLIIGLIISIYLMFNRKLYTSQAKKLLYSLISAKWANRTLTLCREVSSIFSGFIIGKLLDSLIMGGLCFLGMSLLKLPYSTLVSTIVGVTNIIPYFGPFIGAIPSALLLLTVNPIQCLYFVIFILILQQVDGNVIGPKILGTSTGLSSFWVLFSLLFFGGLFGFVGMIIGVPIFAVLYDLAQRGVTYLLDQKNLPRDSSFYENMDSVDPETNQIIPEKKENESSEESPGKGEDNPGREEAPGKEEDTSGGGEAPGKGEGTSGEEKVTPGGKEKVKSQVTSEDTEKHGKTVDREDRVC